MIVLGICMGSPGVFLGHLCPYPRKTIPTLRHVKFMGIGMGFSRVPVFLRVFRVTGFQVTLASGYDKNHNAIYISLLAKTKKKQVIHVYPFVPTPHLQASMCLYSVNDEGPRTCRKCEVERRVECADMSSVASCYFREQRING
jgi:hypothetical protein